MIADRLAEALALQERLLAEAAPDSPEDEARLRLLYDEFTRHFDALTGHQREQVHAARRAILAAQESARRAHFHSLSPAERQAHRDAESARRRANEADQRREEAAATGLPPTETPVGMTTPDRGRT